MGFSTTKTMKNQRKKAAIICLHNEKVPTKKERGIEERKRAQGNREKKNATTNGKPIKTALPKLLTGEKTRGTPASEN